MRIEFVEVIGFGPFEERTSVSFPDNGLCLIIGPNESGKSLLMKAIFGVVFGLSQDEVERFRSWSNPGEYEGRVRLATEERSIELVRYFDTQIAEIWDITGSNRRCLFTGEASPEGQDATYFLELGKLVGFQDAEVASSTTFVTDRELETRVSDKLRHIIGGSKRADYDKILRYLRSEFARLTRWDPWTQNDAGSDRDIERLEKELGRLREARHQVLETLRTSSRLQAEIRALMDQYQNLEQQVENEQKALEGLSVLEGLLREERGLRERLTEVKRSEEAVRGLQEKLSASLDQVATEHAPLLHLQTTFLDDVQALSDARREVQRVERDMEGERYLRADLQSNLKSLTEDLQTQFGAFEDLPEDFPEKLALFSARQRELATLSGELEGVEARLRGVEGDIQERYARFIEQEDDYDEQLHTLQSREDAWRLQLSDLDEERRRRQRLQDELHMATHSLQHEFAPFQDVAADFPSRLKEYHGVAGERHERDGQVQKAREEVSELEIELERDHQDLLRAPQGYGEALKSWRTIHHKFETERPRLDRELDTVHRLREEQMEALRLLENRYQHLVDQVHADTPERLREHRQMSEELVSKSRVLAEARERLKAAEDIILSRFGQFLDRPADWGERLETHRKSAEQTDVVLERLRKEEEQWHDLRRELEALTERARAEGEMLEEVSDSFPELLREYARLKPEVDAKEAQIAELKETIRSLEEQALREYAEFFGVPDDFADRLVQYRSDRAQLGRMEKDIMEAWESVSILEEKLANHDDTIGAAYPLFHMLPENVDTTVAIVLRDQAREKQLRDELAMLEQQGHDRPKAAEGGIMGRIRRNTTKLTEDNSNKSRIEQLRKLIFDVEYAIDKAREQLGPLKDRPDLQQVQVDLAGHGKMIKERAQLLAQVEAAQTNLRKLQQQNEELTERLKRQKDQFDAGGDAEMDAKLPRFKAYQGHMSRLNASRKVLKSHLTPPRNDDTGLTELERNQKRLAELATSLGQFAERFSGPPPYDDIAAELIDGFRTYKRRKQEAQRLKARLSNMQSEREIAALRQEANDALRREREKLGLPEEAVLNDLLEEWKEFERLQARVEAEEGIIHSHEQETVDMPSGPPISRLEWLRRRVDELVRQLGELTTSPDLDVLVEDIHTCLSLKARVAQIEEMLANHTPREALEAAREALMEERRHGLVALGLPSDAQPELEVLEPAWIRFQRLQERLARGRDAYNELLEWEGNDSILDRLQTRLQDLETGLGLFTQAQSVTETVDMYAQYLTLVAESARLETALSGMATEVELDEAQFQVELAMETERDALGLLPSESVDHVSGLYKDYRELATERRHQQTIRARLLSTCSVGDRSGSTTEATLHELHSALAELQASLGGFDEAGEEADEVITQFREAQQLKREIEGVRNAIKALRTPPQWEELLQTVQQPVTKLEHRLKAAGDLSDLDALRARFRTFEELQQEVSTARHGLEQHPSLEVLEQNQKTLDRDLLETEERERTLLEARPVLARYFDKFAHRQDDLRPTMTHNLSRLKENLSVLNLALEKSRNSYRQHVQPSTGNRGNLAVLRELIGRREAELARLSTRRDGLHYAVDRLEAVVRDTQEHLVGSLQIRAQDILKVLTADRYREVVLEGLKLEPMVKNRQGQTLRGEAITGGLRDQLFFALRAAMAQELTGNVRLPFMLDDPFVQFDDERLEQAHHYLSALAERTQVVLFTHDQRCRSWGQVLADLGASPAATAVDGLLQAEVEDLATA